MADYKTVVLTGEEVCVTLAGFHCHLRNLSESMIYASTRPGIVPDADGVLGVPAGAVDTLHDTCGKVYLKGSGKVQLVGSDYADGCLGGAEGNGNIDSAVAAAVAKIVANAPEDFDTLKEISDWIYSHSDSAAAMNSEISTLKTSKADKTEIPTKLPADGGNADTLDNLHANQIASNPNLLINPDFRINQRGQTEYSDDNYDGKYTVDRWRLIPVGTEGIGPNGVKFTDSGIGLATNRSYMHLCQPLPDELANFINKKTCTLSVGTATGIAGQVTFTPDNSVDTFAQAVTNTSPIDVQYYSKSSFMNHRPMVNVILRKTEEKLRWVKLELGSIATPFVPPDPATELLKCQRYYQLIRGSIPCLHHDVRYGCFFCGSLPIPMRDIPTIIWPQFDQTSLMVGTDKTNQILNGWIQNVHTRANSNCSYQLNLINTDSTVYSTNLWFAADVWPVAADAEIY